MEYTVNFDLQKSIEYRILWGMNKNIIRRFVSSLDDPQKTQESSYRNIIKMLERTSFAAEHSFDKNCSLEDFRARVPIRTYEDLKPWLSPHENGRSTSITRAKILSFVETSGTTAQPKWIPVTPRWAKSIARAQSLWTLSMIHDHPMVATGKALTMVSPAEHARTEGGFIVGSNTGRMQQEQPWLTRQRYPIPPEVFAIKPSSVKQYVYLRFALQEHITSWTTANPSMLLLLCRRLQEWKMYFTEDLRKGTLRHGPAQSLSPQERVSLESKLIATAPPFDWRPAKIWPLAVINCWKGGSASFFVSRLRVALGGDIPIREVGITASEGYFALPLGSDWDGGVLWTQGHLLEFVDDAGRCLWSWELEEGKRYRLILTTESGLVRYDLKDVVEVVGFCGRTPVIRFVGKQGRFLNAVGEKISEEQLAQAVDEAARKSDSYLVGFTARIQWGDRPCIHLGYEGNSTVGFGVELENALRTINIEYEAKRESERLGEICLESFSPGTYHRFREKRILEGAPAGQLKDPIVAMTEEEWERIAEASRTSVT